MLDYHCEHQAEAASSVRRVCVWEIRCSGQYSIFFAGMYFVLCSFVHHYHVEYKCCMLFITGVYMYESLDNQHKHHARQLCKTW